MYTHTRRAKSLKTFNVFRTRKCRRETLMPPAKNSCTDRFSWETFFCLFTILFGNDLSCAPPPNLIHENVFDCNGGRSWQKVNNFHILADICLQIALYGNLQTKAGWANSTFQNGKAKIFCQLLQYRTLCNVWDPQIKITRSGTLHHNGLEQNNRDDVEIDQGRGPKATPIQSPLLWPQHSGRVRVSLIEKFSREALESLPAPSWFCGVRRLRTTQTENQLQKKSWPES